MYMCGHGHVCVYIIDILLFYMVHMCSILTKQSACRQLLVCVLLSYVIEHVNTNI